MRWHVRIHHDSGRDSEGCSQHHVRGFAGRAGDGQQLFDIARDLAAEIGQDLARGSDDRFGFVVEESGGADVLRQLQLLDRVAKSWMVGYFRNRPGVTSFTRLSVHWAERMVATRSSHAFE